LRYFGFRQVLPEYCHFGKLRAVFYLLLVRWLNLSEGFRSSFVWRRPQPNYMIFLRSRYCFMPNSSLPPVPLCWKS